ncbi:DoxX family protein [Paenibacillus silviterrae]|uniref:DoxX family protein n=1 Tax=Paenibacillus silviterrae TaxID=3242194 RepID=UPI002542C61C|nr:hypothetical protein [Paenibacillus chinjuensis]
MSGISTCFPFIGYIRYSLPYGDESNHKSFAIHKKGEIRLIPLYVLIGAFLFFQMLGLLGLIYFEDWHTSLQGAVSVMLLVTASAHWGSMRPDLIRMVPRALPRKDWIVTITGVFEILGAVGILFPATSRTSSILLALLLIAMFPANIKAAKESLTIGGRPVPRLLLRTVLQIVFLSAILLAG